MDTINDQEVIKEEEKTKKLPHNLDISHSEIESINEYIQHHKTAILVIMFTDIEGFTYLTETKGEKYSAKIRNYHDDILVSAIEEGQKGKVVKFIGDAVMAVFSEPISAVKISLDIQKQLKQFNEVNTELDDINVRIGLHLGQVALEENIHADVFGRHVNRAARIEGLAAGGQVYITFPVFDSAKGWMMDDQSIGWKLHGSYHLKGIEKPAEIYEVYNKGERTPQAPQKGNRVRNTLTPTLTAFIIIVTVIATYLALNINRTSISFLDYNVSEPLILTTGDTVIVDGELGDHIRNAISDIPLGSHVAYWDKSPTVRNYTSFDIKRGKNQLSSLEFSYCELPFMTENGMVHNDSTLTLSLSEIDTISYFNDDGEYIAKSAHFEISAIGRLEGSLANYSITYTITVDGEEPFVETSVKVFDVTSDEVVLEKFKMGSSGPVLFDSEYRLSKQFIRVRIAGVWYR